MIRRLLAALLTFVIFAPLAAWGTLALWLRLPFGPIAGAAICALWLAGLAFVILLAWRRRWFASTALLAAMLIAIFGWWTLVRASNYREWVPDMARVATTAIDGDLLTVNNVRNFHWRSATDFDQRWERRTYHLSQLRGADLFLSYWAGESVAHAIVSFDFADSDPLAFSIEIRKQRGQSYETVAGFFKTYELAIIAADERDVVKVRSTIRGEDVRLYRLDIERATALALLREYAELANDVARRPRWYNTLAENCTTVIFGMAHHLDPAIKLDWRILLPGKLPAYLRENRFVTRKISLTDLTAAAHIGPRAAGPDPDPGFSPRIRLGVPVP
jgi:hypothetical protein